MKRIAKDLGMGIRVVSRRLDECEIPKRSASEDATLSVPRHDLDPDLLKYLYDDQGLTTTVIAKKFGVNQATISRHLQAITETRSRGRDKSIPRERMENVSSVDGYLMVKMPEHPRANSQGYVWKAYLKWEEYYGEVFPEGHRVLYLNGDKEDLSKGNLRAMTPSDFSKFRAYARHRAGTGSAKCPPEKLRGYLEEWDLKQEERYIEDQLAKFEI